MPHAPEVSLVIPAYNHESYVAEAIESVRGQSLEPGEVLAVDDGSVDRTATVLEDSGYSRLTVVRQENRGAHAALNRAIEMARGPWITILNSDDLLLPERIEQTLGIARATGAAFVVGTVGLIDDRGRPLAPEHPTARWYGEARGTWARAGSLAAGAREQNAAVTTSNFFFLKELWRRVGGFRSYRYVHDYDFLLRALGLSGDRVLFEPELETVGYRVHGSNTIAEDVAGALAERESMLRAQAGALARAGRVVRRAVSARAVDRAIEGSSDRPGSPVREHGAGGTPPSAGTATDTAPGSARGIARTRRAVRAGLVVRTLDKGGLERVVATLALDLPAHGVEPSLLCLGSGGETADRLRRAGVPVEIARGSRRAWRRWVERVRPAVLSTHYVPLVFLEEVGSLGVPAVETVHNTYGWYSASDWREETAKCARVAATVAVSRLASEYYARHVGLAAPPTVIPNGVRPSATCVVPRAYARRTLGIGPDEFVFAHVGRIDPQKNQDGILAAFREVGHRTESARLILAGAGLDTALGAFLRAEYADLIASGAVRFEHFPRGVDVLLSAADAFVANSLFEGWSLAASEALWCGLPIVVSDTGGSRELVGDGERGCVVANPAGDPLSVSPAAIAGPDPRALARNREEAVAAMLGVMDVPRSVAARAEHRAGIRRWARERLDSAHSVEAHAELLTRVVGAGSGSAVGQADASVAILRNHES